MFFNIEEYGERGYFDCPFDKRFLIWKQDSIYTWELCLKEESDGDGYPKRIGKITDPDKGQLPRDLPFIQGMSYLAWEILPEYRCQGIMSNLLALFVESVQHQENGFLVAILIDNTPSLRLALKNGFKEFDRIVNDSNFICDVILLKRENSIK